MRHQQNRTATKRQGLYVMRHGIRDEVFDSDAREQIERFVSVDQPCIDSDTLAAHPELLGDVEVLITS
jgi:hypothetical protein